MPRPAQTSTDDSGRPELDQLIAFSRVPALLERALGRRVHVASVYRWHQHGVAGERLAAWGVGRKLATTHDALLDFFERIERSGADSASQARSSSPTKPISPAQQRRIEAAEKQLAAAGA